jgi:tetratricopeptide (TPR) repeat protein
MFAPADPAAAPNISNVQRAAMATAAARMGLDRPLLGWGPATTPLVFPRYRAGLEGGAENALQLHSAPAQLWAELGAVGLAAALALALLAARAAPTAPAAAVALTGYAVFSLFDWQLDVPIFAWAVATFAALLAAPAEPTASRLTPARLVGAFTLAAFALVALFARRDPAPELNTRALALAAARQPESDARAITFLRESLALNPDQEIAHFNLGWLLLTSDPAAAEKHFLSAAHLVPDKGGVYFGLGLARLNQGNRDPAARAFALECLNDPAFATSPWWRDPAIAATRDAAVAAFSDHLRAVGARLPAEAWAARQLPHVAALTPDLGHVPDGPERIYRRERTGYPVLMRNLDLPVPTDLFDVRELASPPVAATPLPPKGWLPSPLLISLLDETPPNRESKIENRK